MLGTYSGDVTKAVLLTAEDLAQNAAHDLAAAGLGQILDNEDGLGGGEGTDRLADLHDQVLSDLVVGLVTLLEGNEGVHSLTGQLVGDTDDSSLSNHV